MNSLDRIYSLIEKNHKISIDSRSIESNDIFLALRGTNFNGNRFALEAIEKGAAMAVVDDPSLKNSPKLLHVDNVLDFLQELATHHRAKLSIPFIALTGSNGKTTTKNLIANVLSKKYRTYSTQGNLNNHIGVPLTILSIPLIAEMAVIEMGANHEGEIETLCGIAKPTHGLITNIGMAHLEGFGSLDGVRRAKSELFHYLLNHEGKIFIDTHNDELNTLLDKYPFGTNTIPYGRNIITISNIHSPNGQLAFSRSSSGGGLTDITTHLAGEYNIENILAALCVGSHFGVDDQMAIGAIEEYTPSNNRSQIVRTKTNLLLIDAYNANPSSMLQALENFNRIPHDYPKVAILGEMLELGCYSTEEHCAIAQVAEGMDMEQLIFIGKGFEPHHGEHQWFPSTEMLQEYLGHSPITNRFILIKGSRGVKLDTLIDFL